MDLPDAEPLTRIEEGWPDLVGAELAKCCRPQLLRGRSLVIWVDQAPVREQLMWMAAALVERVNALCGESVIDAIAPRHHRA
jgi:hypothetical protein